MFLFSLDLLCVHLSTKLACFVNLLGPVSQYLPQGFANALDSKSPSRVTTGPQTGLSVSANGYLSCPPLPPSSPYVNSTTAAPRLLHTARYQSRSLRDQRRTFGVFDADFTRGVTLRLVCSGRSCVRAVFQPVFGRAAITWRAPD